MTAKSLRSIIRAARDADLSLSGLDKPVIIKKLGLTTLLDEDETFDLIAKNNQQAPAFAYEIPYFDLAGERINYSRWKLIPLAEELGRKYHQIENTIARLYFPPLINWAKVAADVSIRIVITEGEKKAAKACLDGIPCFALGGVWNWKSKKWSQPIIKDFELIDWKAREVEICYDADLSENENVAKALAALSNMLGKKGARVFIRYLPTIEGADSLDEFLVKKSVSAYYDLNCSEADFSREMTIFNEQLLYVKEMRGYYSTDECIFYATLPTLTMRYGATKIIGESGKHISAIKEWTEWPHRKSVNKLTYNPGQERLVDGAYNTWAGFGVEPRRGECIRFLDIIKSIDGWEWFLQWLAYPVQYPGAKLYTAVLIWSPETGTGKSFIGGVMQDIYGDENTNTITSVELHNDRKAFMKHVQFILGEEVSSASQRSDTGVLKQLITGPTTTIDEKYLPPYTYPNRTNFMFTSNNPDAVMIEKNDRRFWVGRLDGTREQSYWDELDTWRKNDGASAFMWYLKNQVDCSKFNPRAPAPVTIEKEHMIHATMSSLDQWLDDFLRDPDGMFGADVILYKGRDVFTINNLKELIPKDISGNHKSANAAIGRSLGRSTVIRGGVIRVGNSTKRLFAIRNAEKWKKQINDKQKWAENYMLGAKAVVSELEERRRRKQR